MRCTVFQLGFPPGTEGRGGPLPTVPPSARRMPCSRTWSSAASVKQHSIHAQKGFRLLAVREDVQSTQQTTREGRGMAWRGVKIRHTPGGSSAWMSGLDNTSTHAVDDAPVEGPSSSNCSHSGEVSNNAQQAQQHQKS
jgi:hypothetical protein